MMATSKTYTTAGAFRRAVEERLKNLSQAKQVDVNRLHDNKRVVQVYDYVDDGVPMLARMFERRLKGYSAIGYRVERSGSRS